YFVHEHFQRFATKEHRREGSPLYFVGVLLAGFLPWTGFFGAFRRAWPGRTREAMRARSSETFLFVYAVLVFLFFSVSKSKLIPYLEPIWPATAVLLALGVERSRAAGSPFRVERKITAFFFGVLLAGAAVFAFGVGFADRFRISGPAALVCAGLLAGFLAALLPIRATERLWKSEPALLIAAPWCLFLLGAFLAFAPAARAITPWPLVESLR